VFVAQSRKQLGKHNLWQELTVKEELETEVQTWLRQQSTDFSAAGFDAQVN
jgi:hypothetical protein